MSQERPTADQIAGAIGVAHGAVAKAKRTRERFHRRQPPTREKCLIDAREACVEAAKPLRSWIGMAAWGGIDINDELAMKKQMEALRYERRQIAKML